MWMTPRTDGEPVIAALIAAMLSSDADSPRSRPFISTASTMAMTTSSRPMAIEPRASQRGSPV